MAPTGWDGPLHWTGGRALAGLIRSGRISAREVMAEHLDRIRRINPSLTAVVSLLDEDQCLALADDADRRRERGEPLGALHGVPFAFKDTEPAVGFPCTQGSPIFKDDRPAEDSVLVERVRAAGAIPIGKTNVPEFAMGSHTFNAVFGTTRNPYDLNKSAGGSSGGAGAALAAGLVSLADGADLGCSLRNPANFNNVVALRPSIGLVPVGPPHLPVVSFGVKGPMARSVADAAFLLSVIAGADPRDPTSRPSTPEAFAAPLDRSLRGARVAWSLDLGGLPLDHRVRHVLEPHRQTLRDLGCLVEDAGPDLRDADEVFLTLRRWRSWVTLGPLLATHRHQMKAEAVEEIEAGARITSADLAVALEKHTALLSRYAAFERRFQFLVCAVNQLPPFDATLTWPHEVEGVPMEHYIAWMKTGYWISTTMRPALSVPAGFTPEGLPVGIQIVGRFEDDLGVLQLGHAFEQATQVGLRHPQDP